ncbi:RmlC-like cupin [Mycena rebaudengoi]|nr:RmlC-like cupin [Mycena rebaudengoi]
MLSKQALVLVLAAAMHASADAAADKAAKKAAEAALVGKLRLAPASTDRIALLDSDDQFAFDFYDPAQAATVGAGGKIVTANAGTFPAVIGNGAAMAVGFMEPCSINTPHMHPRATEMQISLNGTIRTGMITENGARFIMTELPAGSMTVFPMGSIHFQANEGCDPVTFVASFNSEDPGALQVAQRFLGLPPDILGITLGDLGVEVIEGLESKIPDNVASGTQECLKKCGLTRKDQPTLQRQPRVSGNAFPPKGSATGGYDQGYPSGHSTTTAQYSTTTAHYNKPSAPAYTASSASYPSGSAYPSAGYSYGQGSGGGKEYSGSGGSANQEDHPEINGFLADGDDSGSSSGGGSNKPSPILIALLAINAFLVISVIVLATLWLRKRRAAARARGHKQLYTAVGAGGDPIFVAPDKMTAYEDKTSRAGGDGASEPLTHGLSHGPYYDPHEPVSRPSSRTR